MSEVTNSAPVSEETPVTNESVDESAEEVSEEIEASAEEAPVKEEPKKSSKKKYTPKVNGRQMEVEIDPENEEEMLKYIQKALAADQKFQEAASLRKNVEYLVNELKSNPRAILSHPEFGIDLKQFAQEILNEEIEEMKKTPEQKELERLKKELEVKTKREQELEEARREAEMEKLREQSFKQFDDELTDALSKSSLPKSPYVVKRIADTLIEAVNLGYTDASVYDVLPIVEQQISGEIQNMFASAPEEVLEQLIGKNNMTRLRKNRLSKMKKPIETANQVKETGKKSEKSDNKESEKIKFNDIFTPF